MRRKLPGRYRPRFKKGSVVSDSERTVDFWDPVLEQGGTLWVGRRNGELQVQFQYLDHRIVVLDENPKRGW